MRSTISVDRPSWPAAARLGAWCALQSLTSNYLLVMTALAMLVSAAAAPRAWIGRDGLRRAAMTGVAALACAIVLLPFLWPYYLANRTQGLVRPFDEVAHYSAQWRDYFATGGRLHYALWSHHVFALRTPLFPGLTVLALAGVALAAGETWRGHRTRAMVALAVTGVVVSFGAAVPGYHWLYDHVPLLQGIRGVVRLGWLWLLALAVLAGVGLARLERRWPARATALAIGAGILVTVEAARTPMGFVRFAGIPPIYAHVAALQNAVLAEFPFPDPDDRAGQRSVRPRLDRALHADAQRLQRVHPGYATSSMRPWPVASRRPTRCGSSATSASPTSSCTSPGPATDRSSSSKPPGWSASSPRPAPIGSTRSCGNRRELAPAGGGAGRGGRAGRAAHLAARA